MYAYVLIIVSGLALATAIVGLVISIRTLRRLDRRLKARWEFLESMIPRRGGR